MAIRKVKTDLKKDVMKIILGYHGKTLIFSQLVEELEKNGVEYSDEELEETISELFYTKKLFRDEGPKIVEINSRKKLAFDKITTICPRYMKKQ